MNDAAETSPIKNRGETLRTMRGTLRQMLAPHPPSSEDNKFLSLLGQTHTDNSMPLLREEIEELSTDNNSSSKETIKKPEEPLCPQGKLVLLNKIRTGS